MNYFFILGRIPSLSILEISAVLKRESSAKILKTDAEAAIISGPKDLRVDNLVHTLGGVIKGGRLLFQIEKNFDAAAAVIARNLTMRAARTTKRITFGLSAYSVSQKPLKGNVPVLLQRTGITLKKELKNSGVSARFVAPKRGEEALSSVVVEKNHLTASPHAEYVFLVGDNSIDIGATSAVQEFEEYSYRDYNRPHRDMKTGLLPPKLARMMVNIAGVQQGATLLDPFCGLGTILQEALLLGFTNVRGSDIEKKNAKATKENIKWLGSVIPTERINPAKLKNDCHSRHALLDDILTKTIIKQCDARNLLSCFQNNSIDAIVTEPTLGPALSRQRPSVSRQEIASLCDLYIASFRAFHNILKNNGRVVIVFPVWLHRSVNPVFIPCIENVLRTGFINVTIPDSLKNILSDKTPRNSILVARPDARVGRELFVFKKITR